LRKVYLSTLITCGLTACYALWSAETIDLFFGGIDLGRHLKNGELLLGTTVPSGTAHRVLHTNFYSQATPEEVLERIRRSTYSPDSITWIYVMNQRRRLKGAVQVVDLVRAEPGASVGDIARLPKHVRPNADLEEVARLMTDYDLTVVPVVDDEEQILGVITVDDVLELVLPRGWRRSFRVFGDD